jgi:hypothetical protein
LIWFSVEEALALEAELARLRSMEPELLGFIATLEDADLPDEFLDSWR